MFLFFTIIFIVLFGHQLFTKSVYVNVAETLLANSIKMENSKDEEKKNSQIKVIICGAKFVLFGFLLIIVEPIYILSALNHDPMKIPTILMICYFIYNMFFKAKSKVNLKVDNVERLDGLVKTVEMLKEKTFKKILFNLLNTIYFLYIFYIVVF
jgi:hypothetical protein